MPYSQLISKLEKLDRRWIFLTVALAVLFPLIFPLRIPLQTAASTQAYYDRIEALPEGSEITGYRQGEFFDLCRGPHIPNLGKINLAGIKIFFIKIIHT